ncbi:MAG: hypothetical protein FJ034_03795 [Chloroflexi bacterium]|nr:hypothetical protein [Chloroflexota bacterium]
MSTFVLTRLGRGRIDQCLARMPWARLWRRAGRLYLDLHPEDSDAAVRSLAYAGVRAEPSLERPAIPERSVGARGTLGPMLAPLALDVVVVGRVPLGLECARLLARPLPWWPGASQRVRRCRALLRGEDAAYRWTRRAWAPGSVLRDRAVASVLRPAVFSGVSFEEEPRHLGYAASASLERWAFA